MRALSLMTLTFFALASPPTARAATGAAFLTIDTGARPAAMGGAYSAISDDVHSLHYNPAGLSRLGKRELGFTHAQWLLGAKFDVIGYAQPTSLGSLGLGITRLSHGSLESRSQTRQAQATYEASDTAYTVSFGRSLKALDLPGKAGLGASVKYLESRIGADSAASVALDLGSSYELAARPIALALVVRNLGQGLRFLDQTDPLPLSVSLAGAYRMAGALDLSVELRREAHGQATDLGLGSEYAVLPRFSIRAGYASRMPEAGQSPGGLSALAGLAGGFGLRLGAYQADYAFIPFGPLGGVQRLSLGARW